MQYQAHIYDHSMVPTIVYFSLEYDPGVIVGMDGEGVVKGGRQSPKHMVCIHTPRASCMKRETEVGGWVVDKKAGRHAITTEYVGV